MDRRRFIAIAPLTATAAAFPEIGRTQSKLTERSFTVAQQLAQYAYTLRYQDLDPATVEAVKGHLLDSLACAVAAFDEKPVEIARRIAQDSLPADRAKGATLIGTEIKSTVDLATFANGSAIRQLDLNDLYVGKEIGHPSDLIAPCVAVAQAEKSTGRELILAIALAYEINCRLLDAATITTQGWDHPSLNLPAIALACGKLMKLSQSQLAQAISLAIAGHLALNQTRIQDLSNWKGMAAADIARNAVFATNLAREGLTGPAPIFEGNAGFFRVVTGPITIDTTKFGGKDTPFLIHKSSIKFYPAQGMTQTAIVAALEVAKQVKDLARIKSIEILTSADGYKTAGMDPQKWLPETSETADHSLPYIVARAMFDGDIGIHSYEHELITDPKIRAFMQKIKVTADPELTKIYPKYYATIIRATLNDGSQVSKRVDDLPGFATRPMQRTDYEAKFKKYGRHSLSTKQIDQTVQFVWQLDQKKDVSPIFSSLVVAGKH